MRMFSFFRVLTKRLLLSAAVKKMLVRFVSTRTTSSVSPGKSSFGFTGGVGEATSDARLLLDFCTSALFGVWANDLLAIIATVEAPTTNARAKLTFPNP